MMESAIQLVSSDHQDGIRGKDVEKIALSHKTVTQGSTRIEKLLMHFIKTGASDMLLTAGAPPSIKIRSQVHRISSISLTPQDCEDYAKELLDHEQWQRFIEQNELDLAVTYPGTGRFRMNFYRQRNSVSISIRHITDKIPTLKELKLPEWLRKFRA
jgi:Tfp pilus assembly ATPase PilU